MRKFMSLILSALVLFVAFLPVTVHAEEKTGDTLRVVSTIFPPYDFVRQIAGDNVELTMLLKPGSESHSFEPSPQDIIRIQNCDVFLYIGGETDAWVERILSSMDTADMTILSLIDMVETAEEVIVEGMEHNHDHGEIDPDAIHDRPLSDWAGEWQSIYTSLQDEAGAEDLAKWETELSGLVIDANTIQMTTESNSTAGTYAYQGYSYIPSDHGGSVWYQFALDAPSSSEGLPAYVMFSDHDTGAHAHEETGDAHEHEEEHEHGAELPHFHMRYGNDGFDALLAIENWAPTYFPNSAGNEEILHALSDHGHSHEEPELDEHVWTSPQKAKQIVLHIAGALSQLDPGHADVYAANANAYAQELDALDQAFEQVTTDAARNVIVFGDRFPFRYLADAYDLTYYAAFPGCATETEASVATVAFLIDKVREENIPVVFQIEFSNGKMTQTIAESTGAAVLQMHSCHNVSKDDFEAGVGYLDLMWQNVEQLREALH